MIASAARLKLDGVSKRFSGVQALEDVDFELAPGEIHALLGENGAGKSTLIRLMTGVHPLDAGRIVLDGALVRPSSPAAAQKLGISTVHQEVNLLPNLSVAHNLLLGREPRRFACLDWKTLNAQAQRMLQRFGLDIDVTETLDSFSVAVRQLVAIARGVAGSARVLVLDEPTASLDAAEVDLLFGILRQLKREGMSIVFVTHFLDQVYDVSDRITVLRNGRRVGTFETATLPRAELIAHMLGRELLAIEQLETGHEVTEQAAVAIEARDLAADNGLSSISLTARRGEALGLAGLLGSGRTEICETLFGLAKRTAGELRILGRPVRVESPASAMRLGLALCPEDRRSAGILGPLSVRENICVALQVSRGWWRRIGRREQHSIAAEAVEHLGIVCPDIETPVERLSGGNQQKVVLARWLCNRPRVLVLDEPTRGIDVGAHAELLKLIRRLRDDGLTVIVASSELDELVALCDTVVVMRNLRVVGELRGADVSAQQIVAAIAQAG
jgi:simple sugar transport system ATP-binding protein